MTYTPDETRAVRYSASHEIALSGGEERFDAWLAAEEARIRADERWRIVEAIRDLEYTRDERNTRIHSGIPTDWLDGHDAGVEDAARIAEEAE